MMRLLSQLHQGEKGIVSGFSASQELKNRLSDYGLIEGTVVHCAYWDPGKHTQALSFRGSVLAIRKEDSGKILLEEGA